MILQGELLKRKTLEKLAKTESLGALLRELKKTYYGKYINFDENMPLTDIELSLQNYNLKNAALKSHQNPMSISSVLSFMISKIIEVKNLRSIVKSKHLGIEEDYVEKNLLIV